MGVRLHGSTGKCACSNCYQPVEPGSTFCDSCGDMLEREVEAKACPSCETLMTQDSKSCPICSEKFIENPGEEDVVDVTHQLGKEDEEFLMKVMGWAKSWETTNQDTDEDKQEREKAMNVLKSIATIESDDVMEEQIKEIEETAMERNGFEQRRKQLLKLGKPFESLLERNVNNMGLVDKDVEECQKELAVLEGKDGKKYDEKRTKLEKRVKILQKKKQAMMSYESNILMIGGAYRSILGHHQNELLRVEEDLKKRVEAFQKEVERRKKQKQKLKSREEALDRREEELSRRFLDLKSRENEIKAREDEIDKSMEELYNKENELKVWEEEISQNKKSQTADITPQETVEDMIQEEWLAAQRKLQADLMKMREEELQINRNGEDMVVSEGILNNMDEALKERENELSETMSQLEELKSAIIEKDKEIEKLKENGSGFSLDEETRKLLQILDDLLEKLPDEVVDKFARSDDYLLYERVLEKYKL